MAVGVHSLRSFSLSAFNALPLQLFLWSGRECQPSERARGREIGQRYLAACGRPHGEVVEVDAGQEPHFFTAHFAGALACLLRSS
jgi:hypothetical protein